MTLWEEKGSSTKSGVSWLQPKELAYKKVGRRTLRKGRRERKGFLAIADASSGIASFAHMLIWLIFRQSKLKSLGHLFLGVVGC